MISGSNIYIEFFHSFTNVLEGASPFAGSSSPPNKYFRSKCFFSWDKSKGSQDFFMFLFLGGNFYFGSFLLQPTYVFKKQKNEIQNFLDRPPSPLNQTYFVFFLLFPPSFITVTEITSYMGNGHPNFLLFF